MDALSGAASVTAIVAIAFQSVQVIHDVVSGIRNGPDQIRRLAESVEDLRGILEQLRDLNDNDTGLLQAIKNCTGDLEGFKIKLRKLKTPGETKVRMTWGRVVMILKKEEFHKIQTVLQSHCTGLSLRLNTMQRALGIQQKIQFDSMDAMIQGSLHTATLDIQPALLKIGSVCETHNEKLDRFQEMQIIRQMETKKNIQEQVGVLSTTIQHSGREILQSISEQFAAVANMSMPQFKSLEALLLQVQQSVAAASCHNATGVQERHYDTIPEAFSLHESNTTFNKNEQADKDVKDSTRVEVLESICRLSRLASEKPRTSFSKEAQDVIEDIEKLFDLGHVQVHQSAQTLGKRKRESEEGDIADVQWIHGLRKTQNLLSACSSVALNQSVTSLQRQASKKYKVRRRHKLYSTSLGTILQYIGLRRNHQELYITDEDEGKDNTVEIFVAGMTFIPKDARFGFKISSSFLQTMTAQESLSRIPTLSFCRMIANQSEVFSLVANGNLVGLVRLLKDGRAALTDCDEEGRSLLTYACHHQQPRVCKYLIEGGADVDSVEKPFSNAYWSRPWTPIAQIIEPYEDETEESLECMRLLLQADCDPMIGSGVEEGRGPLLGIGRSIDSMRMIFNLGGDFIDMKVINDGGVPDILAHALWEYRPYSISVECVSFLLSRGVDPNIRTRKGNSCLHEVVTYNYDQINSVKIMVLLINAGADIHAINNRGMSVTEMAYTYNCGDERSQDSIGLRGANWDEALTECGYDVALFHKKFPKTPGFNHIMDTSKIGYGPKRPGCYRWLEPGWDLLTDDSEGGEWEEGSEEEESGSEGWDER
ncbi:hypothetical protein MMC18_009404 [Xylographa bjoerkii]|nr:hypothetical protein [Xylographa bjoerkii]